MKSGTNQVCDSYFRIRRTSEAKERAKAATMAETKVQIQGTKSARQRAEGREQRDRGSPNRKSSGHGDRTLERTSAKHPAQGKRCMIMI